MEYETKKNSKHANNTPQPVTPPLAGALRFEQVDEHHPLWSRFYGFYEEAFPDSERKSEAELLRGAPMTNPEWRPEHRLYFLDEEPVAALSFWWKNEDVFGEYLAVRPDKRNLRLGQRIFEGMMQETGSIVLEIEVPETEWSVRRLGFYERLGFVPQMKNYHMPDMSRPGEAVPMWLLRWPEALDESVNDKLEREIHAVVYRVKKD